ncbi:MAG: YraN family protein [bacterium]
MSDYKLRLGNYGENLAREFLQRHGHKIIGKNFNTLYGEIDLIAENGDELLFCEVKTRTSAEYGYPEQAVDWKKIRHLNKAINIYLQNKNIDKFWRLDVVAIEINSVSKKARISWFKDVLRD